MNGKKKEKKEWKETKMKGEGKKNKQKKFFLSLLVNSSLYFWLDGSSVSVRINRNNLTLPVKEENRKEMEVKNNVNQYL